MKKLFLFLLPLVTSLSVEAQVMWNLKGGIMQRSYLHGGSLTEDKRIDWMAGLELEIPLSSKLNLETGLRYNNYYSLVPGNNYGTRLKWTTNHIELPIRVAYKQPLGKHFMLHAGMGPYASYAFGKNFGGNEHLQIGLEPSVVINWSCLSLGVSYDIPCFYKSFKDKNNPAVMATLGIRFRSHVWKYVGATMLAIGSLGSAAAAVWPTNDSYSSYGSGSYSPSYSSGSSSNYSGSSSSSVGNSCKFCAGSGRCSGYNRCRGDGQCKYCYGQGYQSTNGHYHECGVCKGTKKCTFCGGSGKCKHCGGTGKN